MMDQVVIIVGGITLWLVLSTLMILWKKSNINSARLIKENFELGHYKNWDKTLSGKQVKLLIVAWGLLFLGFCSFGLISTITLSSTYIALTILCFILLLVSHTIIVKLSIKMQKQ